MPQVLEEEFARHPRNFGSLNSWTLSWPGITYLFSDCALWKLGWLLSRNIGV